MATQTKLLDFDGIAVVLGVPPRQARELYRRGCFPGVKLSRKYLRFDPADVLAAVKRNGGRKNVTS
jgi:hypothetical protein